MKTCSRRGTYTVAVLMLALNSGVASAHGTVTAPLADYNSAQVAAANGTVTVPFGGIIANAVYTVAAGTQLEVGSLFTITLPSGFVFQSNPVVVAPGSTTVTVHSGGVSGNSITYQIGVAAVPAAGTLSVGAFNVSGATALESQFGGNPLPMTFQSTGNVTSNNNDAAPVSVPVFTHAVGSLPDTITPGSGQIDLGSLPPGTQFVPSGATVATAGQVATFAINTELNDPFNSNAPVLSPNGLANSLNANDTANITVSGPFTGIATAYADPTVTTCQNSVPGGSIIGTVTPTSLTFNGVKINTPVQICMIPDGTTLMQPGTQPYVYTYSSDSPDFFGGLAQTTANNFYTYNGSVVQEILYTVTFPYAYSARQMYIRIVNDGPGAAEIVAEVKADNGDRGYTTLAVPSYNNVFVPVSQIIKQSGVVLDSTNRASMMFVTASVNVNLKIAQILIDTSTGAIVQIGSGSSP
ncbi:MAG: hypothetical protein P4L83_18300 [Nevskia sp.]|nr:hypothetical protein [Nevskia sp.]